MKFLYLYGNTKEEKKKENEVLTDFEKEKQERNGIQSEANRDINLT